MADVHDRKARSRNMRAVKRAATAPEVSIRHYLAEKHIRYWCNVKRLPGAPDIVLIGRRKVVLVHGCFWHGHSCKRGKLPVSNRPFWENKIAANVRRDKRAIDGLAEKGWKCLVIWECQIASEEYKKNLDAYIEEMPVANQALSALRCNGPIY